MLHDFFKAIGSYGTALTYMTRRRLWHWQIVPGLLSLLIGAVVFGLAYRFGDNLGSWMVSWYPWDWGRSVVEKVFHWIGAILIVITGLFAYRYILLMTLSPVLSLLSEQTEKIHLGAPMQQGGFSVRRMVRDVRRGLYLTIRNLIRELLWTALLSLLSVIPGINSFTTPAIFAVQSFYAGFGNMDFTMERYMAPRERIAFVRRYKGLAIGNGLIFLAILFIPVIGLFLAPTLGVIASTIDVLDRLERE